MIMMRITLVLISVVCVVKSTDFTGFTNCSSTSGHIESGQLISADIQCHSVWSDPRTHKQVCQLLGNSSASIRVNFTSNVNTTQVKSVVHGILPGIPDVFMHLISHDKEQGYRFLGVKEDACFGNNVDHCNIKAGETVQYTNILPVDEKYPKVYLYSVTGKRAPLHDQSKYEDSILMSVKVVWVSSSILDCKKQRIKGPYFLSN